MRQLALRPIALTRLGLAIVVAAIMGACLGIIVRSPSSPAPAPARPAAAVPASDFAAITIGDIRLRLPPDWLRAQHPLAVPGLAGPRSLALEASTGSVVIAQVPPGDPTLLPAPLLQALAARPGGSVLSADLAEPVRRGRVAMLHYANLTLPGVSAPLDLYAMPTTVGSIVLACTTGTDGCAGTLAGLRLTRGRVLALGPDAALRSALPATVSQLDAVRIPARSRLARAGAPGEQAAAAAELGAAYRAAARTVSPLGTGTTLVAGLRAVWHDYRLLAQAATDRDAAAFKAATAAVAKDDGVLSRELARVSAGTPR